MVLESVMGVDSEDLRRAEVARRRGGAARVGQLEPHLRMAVTALIVEQGIKFSW